MEYIAIVISVVALIVSCASLYIDLKGRHKDKIIAQSIDLAERAQSLNQKNGNKLTSTDKKQIAMQYALSQKKMKPSELSNRIEAELERRKRNG